MLQTVVKGQNKVRQDPSCSNSCFIRIEADLNEKNEEEFTTVRGLEHRDMEWVRLFPCTIMRPINKQQQHISKIIFQVELHIL